MKIQNALVSNLLYRSRRYFAHVTTVTLSWRVKNIVVIGHVYFTLKCFEFSSNFEFDRNMLSGTGARLTPVTTDFEVMCNTRIWRNMVILHSKLIRGTVHYTTKFSGWYLNLLNSWTGNVNHQTWASRASWPFTWWRRQMKSFSALLAICAGNSPVTGEFPAQRSVTRSSDVFFDLLLNKRVSKQWWGWWFETPSRRPLLRHCDVQTMVCFMESYFITSRQISGRYLIQYMLFFTRKKLNYFSHIRV